MGKVEGPGVRLGDPGRRIDRVSWSKEIGATEPDGQRAGLWQWVWQAAEVDPWLWDD